MLDLNCPLRDASAQALVAALMLLYRERDLMERVVLELDAHRHLWSAFVLAPALPASEDEAYLGILICLRDLALGWSADTLYILTSDFTSAEALRSLAQGWGCSEIMMFSAERTEYLVSRTGILIAARWQFPTHPSKQNDYHTLYADNSKIRADLAQPIGECTAQTIVAALVRCAKFGKFEPELVLSDLDVHAHLWRSFILGPPLPGGEQDLQSCLETLIWLPAEWGGNWLYVWAWDEADAMCLRSLAPRWKCDAVRIIDEQETTRLLHLPTAAPLVIYEWDDFGMGWGSSDVSG